MAKVQKHSKSSLGLIWSETKSRWALNFILVFIIVGILSPFLANRVPIICQQEGKISMPIFLSNLQHLSKYDLKTAEFDWYIGPLIPYKFDQIDRKNSNSISPFESQEVTSLYYRHWLGTDILGRDVLAGLIHGTWIALLVGLFSSLVAVFLGLLLGGLAGYYGDYGLKLNRLTITYLFLLSVFLIYYINYFSLSIGFWLFLILLCLPIYFIEGLKLAPKRWNVAIPMDLIIFRIIELYKTIPELIILLVLLGLLGQGSLIVIVLIIGFIRWVSTARFVRAEILVVKRSSYVLAAKASGSGGLQIFLKHILPNALRPVFVNLAFGFSVAILLESTLSFLGLGLGIDQVTWGSLLSEARRDFSAWWLALIPGGVIFIIIASFNILAERINQILNPKEL